jgi:hypothetical protein
MLKLQPTQLSPKAAPTVFFSSNFVITTIEVKYTKDPADPMFTWGGTCGAAGNADDDDDGCWLCACLADL